MPNSPTLPQIVALGGAAAAGLALVNTRVARAAEAANPPLGRFVHVGGVPVHAVDMGPRDDDQPIVLLHGNVVTLHDWLLSGVVEELGDRRVVAFDRPGFGYTARPRDVTWGAREQAALLRGACDALGVHKPVVVGHSWATLVALAWALDAPDHVAALGLLSGYYYPSLRLDGAMAGLVAAPLIGDGLRYTVSPPMTHALLPTTIKSMFAPMPVPDRFWDGFPQGLVARPTQIRAAASEGAIMVGETKRLLAHPGVVRCKVALMAGSEDQVVDPYDQSDRLARDLGMPMQMVEGAGHMVHHARPDAVARTIEGLADA